MTWGDILKLLVVIFAAGMAAFCLIEWAIRRRNNSRPD